MDPWALFGQQMAEGFYKGKEARDRQKLLQQEALQRMALAKYSSELEAQAPTAEMKLMNLYNQNPQAFGSTMSGMKMAMDPMAQQEMALKQQAMGNQNYQQQLDYWKLKYGPQYNSYYGLSEPTSQQRNYDWLMRTPGMNQEKALQLLFRPDLMSQVMGAIMGPSLPGTGGGVAPQGMRY